MFKLGGIRAFDITQRWICFDDPARDQVVQLLQVSGRCEKQRSR